MPKGRRVERIGRFQVNDEVGYCRIIGDPLESITLLYVNLGHVYKNRVFGNSGARAARGT